jgi:putative sterol carrier protein
MVLLHTFAAYTSHPLDPRPCTVCYANMNTDKKQLIETLGAQFNAKAAEHINAKVNLATQNGHDGAPILSFSINQMSLKIMDETSEEADITLIADELDTFERILTGRQHLVSAFMQGNFQSDGYLVLVFQVLSVFTSRDQNT